jgi:hypothetical protein
MQTATDQQQRILNYLNARPSNQFTAIAQRNREAAYVEADKRENDIDAGMVHHWIDNILDQSKPFYRPSKNGNTLRVFSIGESLATIPSKVRRALTTGWYELDLKSCGFAVAAMLWNIESINMFLRNGGDLWDDLLRHFDRYSHRDDLKSILKTCVYALINMSSRRFTKEYIDERLGDGAGDHFFAYPSIAALWKARRTASEQVICNRGAPDAFSTWIPLQWSEHNGRRIPEVGNVIAQQYQSYELLLLLPVYDLAEQTDEFMVMIHQHDGLTVAVSDQRRTQYWLDRITSVVQEQADRLGIYTHLAVAV